MSDHIIKASRLTSIPKNFDGIAQSLLYELPRESGYVFGIYQISGKKTAIKEKMAITLNEHIDRFRQTLGPNTNIARKFEHMLQAINDQLASISKDFQQFPLSDFNAVIGVVNKKQLFLTGFGNILTEYLHKKTQSRYTIYELSQQFEPLESTTWDKVFISVLDGELHASDVFYTGFKISSKELDHSLLQETLTTLPPAGALKRLEQFLGANEPYAGVCIQISEPQTNVRKKINPIASIDSLNKTKDLTSDLLGETSSLGSLSLPDKLRNFARKMHQPGHRGTSTIFKQILRQLIRILASIIAGISFIYKQIKPYTIKLSSWLKNKDLGEKVSKLLKSFISKVIGLKHSSKQAKIVFILLIVATIGGLYTGSRIIKSAQENQLVGEFEEIKETIEDKQAEARNRLIFNDTNSAREILTETRALIASLPDIRSRRSDIEILKNETELISNEIQGITRVDVNLLATFENNLSSVSLFNNQIYVSSDKEVLSYNNINGNLNNDFSLSSGFSQIVRLISGDSLLFIDSNKQLGRLSNESGNPLLSGTNSLSTIADIDIYNETLYVLNPNSEQIIRMRNQNSNFEAGTPWIISKDTDISSARSLAIDGDIYVTLPDNILKFRSGRELPFSEAEVEPRLENISRIYTSNSLNHIYALEPSNSRIIVFDKEGNFITQYKTPELESATGITIDESKLQLIFTSNNNLYSFTLNHLLN